MSFPELLLAGLIVAAGIFVMEQYNSTAAWLLTILILLTIAFRWGKFADQLASVVSLFGVTPKQDSNFDPSVPNIPLS